MENHRKLLVVALVLTNLAGAAMAIEMKDGAFPVGSDYQSEKERQGADPANYKKVYHRVIPGGAEHAEVSASNGPGSNSWSQTYSKHQSFGSADTVQSQSYSSSNGKHQATSGSQDAMARHNEMMSSIHNMGLGTMGMGMGLGMPQFGLEPKVGDQEEDR